MQETLRKLIDSGTTITPEVIDALRRTKPKRSPAEIRASVTRYRYWGLFLLVLWNRRDTLGLPLLLATHPPRGPPSSASRSS